MFMKKSATRSRRKHQVDLIKLRMMDVSSASDAALADAARTIQKEIARIEMRGTLGDVLGERRWDWGTLCAHAESEEPGAADSAYYVTLHSVYETIEDERLRRLGGE